MSPPLPPPPITALYSISVFKGVQATLNKFFTSTLLLAPCHTQFRTIWGFQRRIFFTWVRSCKAHFVGAWMQWTFVWLDYQKSSITSVHISATFLHNEQFICSLSIEVWDHWSEKMSNLNFYKGYAEQPIHVFRARPFDSEIPTCHFAR